MQKAVSEWNSEAKRSTSHLPVNFEILLKQASVLQGLCLGGIFFDRDGTFLLAHWIQTAEAEAI